MNRAKVFIVFTCLLAFVVGISAQTPKIVWKSLQERYESFEEIKPQIVNESGFPLYYDAYYFPHLDFERFDEKSNSWVISRVWHCGTGYKPSIIKINLAEQVNFNFGKDDWEQITTEDSIGEPKFRKFHDYDGTGKYRFKFTFSVKKSALDSLVSYSPEFKVVEKDFKK